MPRIRHRLEHSLILLDDYLHPLFGAPKGSGNPFLAIKESLGSAEAEGFDSNGRSFLAQRLRSQYKGSLADLETYDDNIKRHLDNINAHRAQDDQIVLKYFQHLSLLYTEHVLHQVFTNLSGFVVELNKLVEVRNEAAGRSGDHFSAFTEGDLTKLAYWMATGSGKTLLLHMNYHQVQHYASTSQSSPFENILLITPNAGLSQQHLEELQKSSIPARIFRQGDFRVPEGTIQIIEITKFTEGTIGPQTVNVSSFEGNNLIFVDEGHRGASGDVWIKYREQLASEGFTFEYSATFGEAFNSGNTASDIETRHSYGKSIVFDYRYKYFHGDGYGKDYTVLNLPRNYIYDERDTLLLANLLTLYEQTLLFLDNKEEMSSYNIERPLLMFVGRTVQAGKTKSQLNQGDKASLSDVLDIVRFLNQVSSDQGWAVSIIEKILIGNSGLLIDGSDAFTDKFPVLRQEANPEAIYTGLLESIFHAPASGPIHLSNLKNATGEISLRAGASDTPFGVINIGDDSNFLSMAEEAGLDLQISEDDAFRGSLFGTINQSRSNINILVGAKKFTEGWNSWRISGMGLLNVGRSEGSEVIQMFGRGVRLKGYGNSLKRSSELDGSHPAYLQHLETLNIFSVNGDYLAEFKNALDREGIIEGYEEIDLPIEYTTFDAEKPKLYIIRPRGDKEFVDQPAFSLQADKNPRIRPEIDIRPQVQQLSSRESGQVVQTTENETVIPRSHLAVLDWDDIYLEMLNWKRQRSFSNMVVAREVLQQIMTTSEESGRESAEFYILYAQNSALQIHSVSDIARIRMIVLSILKKYAEQYYYFKKQQWESNHLEYRLLDKSDPNMKPTVLSLAQPTAGYVIKVNRQRPDLISAVEQLIEQGSSLYQQDQSSFPNIVFDRHLYAPLIAKGYYDGHQFTDEPDIKSVPVGLNRGEARFVCDLRRYLAAGGSEKIGERKLYLLRNLSRGKGIGFFEATNFYPDFILWVVADEGQRIVFVDPKGLALLHPNNFTNPKIQLYTTLQNSIAPRLGDENISLDSYIISDRDYSYTSQHFGNSTDPHSREEFRQNHVLFPDTAAADLIDAVLE